MNFFYAWVGACPLVFLELVYKPMDLYKMSVNKGTDLQRSLPYLNSTLPRSLKVAF